MSAVLSLTLIERSNLAAHEQTIDRARSAFVDAGLALSAIRDGKLYRETHSTFEDYCRDRWQFEKSHVYRLMDAAEVVKVISKDSPIGEVLPANERQARPLVDVPEENRAEVWAEVVETAPRNDAGAPVVTARHVEAVVEKRAHVANNSGENEWYTPPAFTAAAREVMGEIDLDPASCETANASVQAAQIYTASDNGLEQPWSGRVWMNPPYAQPLIAEFCNALIKHIACQTVTQACVLVNNGTETAWGQQLIANASAVCFPKSRIRFVDKEGKPSGAPLQGQMICYFGASVDEFSWEFSKFGVVLRNG